MRTVLSQQAGGLKPGQATILISQPPPGSVAAHAPQTITQPQVVQAGAVKTSGRGSPKGKGQPVYARIITPPPGMKLAGVPGVAGFPGNLQAAVVGGKIVAAPSSAGQQAAAAPVVNKNSVTVVSPPAQNDSG